MSSQNLSLVLAGEDMQPTPMSGMEPMSRYMQRAKHNISHCSISLLDRNHRLWEGFVAARRDVIAPACQFGTTAFPTLDGATEDTINRLETLLLDKYETSILSGSWF